MELEINHKNTEKHEKTWKINNMLLNNEWVNNKIKEEISPGWSGSVDSALAWEPKGLQFDSQSGPMPGL